MIQFRRILFSILFVVATLQVNAGVSDHTMNGFPIIEEPQDDVTSLDVNINNTTKIKMENIPTSGYLEVYSILGVKVTSINLKTCVGSCYIDLPKGLYILKAGKTAQKIIVR